MDISKGVAVTNDNNISVTSFSAVALADYDLKQGTYKINYSATNDWFPGLYT